MLSKRTFGLALSLVGALVAGAAAGEGRKIARPLQLAARIAPGETLAAANLDRLFDAARPAPSVYLDIPARLPGGGGTQDRNQSLLLMPMPTETAPYRATFRRLLGNPSKIDKFDDAILERSRRHGLDPRLLKAIIAAESEFTTTALSPAGARGLMQLMGKTAEEFGVPASALGNPHQNITAGAAYLAHLFKRAWKKFGLPARERFSNAPLWVVQRVIAAYNAGPRFLNRRPIYRETKEYLKKVLLFYRSRVTQMKRHPLAPVESPRLDAPAGSPFL